MFFMGDVIHSSHMFLVHTFIFPAGASDYTLRKSRCVGSIVMARQDRDAIMLACIALRGEKKVIANLSLLLLISHIYIVITAAAAVAIAVAFPGLCGVPAVLGTIFIAFPRALFGRRVHFIFGKRLLDFHCIMCITSTQITGREGLMGSSHLSGRQA
jgi:hypothetical protein